MTTALTILGLDKEYPAGDEASLRKAAPYAHIFLESRPEVVAHILRILPTKEADNLLRELLVWSTSRQDGATDIPYAHLIDVARDTGKMQVLAKHLTASDAAYDWPRESLSRLATKGDLSRFGLLLEEVIKADIIVAKAMVEKATIAAIQAGHRNIVDAALAAYRQLGEIPYAYILRTAIRCSDWNLVDKIIETHRQNDRLSDLAKPPITLPFSIFWEGVERSDISLLNRGLSLVDEITARLKDPTPCNSDGEALPTIEGLVEKLRRFTAPFQQEEDSSQHRIANLHEVIFAFTPNPAQNPCSAGYSALLDKNKDVLHWIQDLATRRSEFQPIIDACTREYVYFEHKPSPEAPSVFSELLATLLKTSKEQRRYRHREADTPPVVPEAPQVPDNFNRGLYAELLPIMQQFNATSAGYGKPEDWARKLTILFEDKEQVVRFLRASISAMARDDQNKAFPQGLLPGIFRWPERASMSESILQPYIVSSIMESISLPSKAFDTAEWRRLILAEPEAVRFLPKANDLEAFWRQQQRSFPETLDELRRDVVEEFDGRYGTAIANSLRPTLTDGNALMLSDTTQSLRLGVLIDVALEPGVLTDFDALAQTGALGTTVRLPSRKIPQRVREKGEGEFRTINVIQDPETGGMRAYDWQSDSRGLEEGAVPWRHECVQVIFDSSRPYAFFKTGAVLSTMKAIFISRADDGDNRDANIHIDTRNLSPDGLLAVQKQILAVC